MIDVSEFQGVIDWHKVHAGGIRHAYIKLAQGERHGAVRMDAFGVANVHHARGAGIVPGMYWFADPRNGAAHEAERFLHLAAGLWHPGDMPLALDLEVEAGHTLAALDAWKGEFFQVIDKAIGTRGVFYSFRSFLDAFHFFDDRPIWGAHPTTLRTDERARWSFWQHGQGRCAGIAGQVDFDLLLHPDKVPAIPAL